MLLKALSVLTQKHMATLRAGVRRRGTSISIQPTCIAVQIMSPEIFYLNAYCATANLFCTLACVFKASIPIITWWHHIYLSSPRKTACFLPWVSPGALPLLLMPVTSFTFQLLKLLAVRLAPSHSNHGCAPLHLEAGTSFLKAELSYTHSVLCSVEIVSQM